MFETPPETRILQFTHNPTEILSKEFLYKSIYEGGKRAFTIFLKIMVDFNSTLHVGKKILSGRLQRTFIMDLLNFIFRLSWQI